MKFSIFASENNLCILHGHVFVMPDNVSDTYPEFEDGGGWGGGPTSFISRTRSLKNENVEKFIIVIFCQHKLLFRLN